MANIIDTTKLEEYIVELERLYQPLASCRNYPKDTSGCGGSMVIQIERITGLMQDIQDGFVLLSRNTVSYMRQRKTSVEIKEEIKSGEIRVV